MKTITPMDMRRSLGRILDEASAGERFLVTRDHKPLAVLISPEEAERLEQDHERLLEQRRAALDALDDWGRRYRASLPPDYDGPNAAEWIRADRDSH